jgi:hypothetical protein
MKNVSLSMGTLVLGGFFFSIHWAGFQTAIGQLRQLYSTVHLKRWYLLSQCIPRQKA